MLCHVVLQRFAEQDESKRRYEKMNYIRSDVFRSTHLTISWITPEGADLAPAAIFSAVEADSDSSLASGNTTMALVSTVSHRYSHAWYRRGIP